MLFNGRNMYFRIQCGKYFYIKCDIHGNEEAEELATQIMNGNFSVLNESEDDIVT